MVQKPARTKKNEGQSSFSILPREPFTKKRAAIHTYAEHKAEGCRISYILIEKTLEEDLPSSLSTTAFSAVVAY